MTTFTFGNIIGLVSQATNGLNVTSTGVVAPSYTSTTASTTAAMLDNSGTSTLNITSGTSSNAAFWPNQTGYLLVTIAEVLNTGGMSLWLCGNGTCILVGQSAAWVTTTTTPTSGNFSVHGNGTGYAIYNNFGSTCDFAVMVFKLH